MKSVSVFLWEIGWFFFKKNWDLGDLETGTLIDSVGLLGVYILVKIYIGFSWRVWGGNTPRGLGL